MVSIAKCIICGEEFIKTRKDKVCCSAACSSRKRKIKKNNERNIKLMSDIENFLHYMKSKSHYAELPDIFRLLDLHERLFPSTFIDDDADKELIFSKLYMEIIDSYKKSFKD